MKSQSLQWHITRSTLIILLITAMITGAFSFISTHDETGELIDEQLRSVAHAVLDMNVAPESYPADDDDGIWVDVVRSNHPLADTPTGFSFLSIGGDEFQVYHLSENDKSIIVRQRKDSQDELATLSALYSLVPLLAVSGVLMVVLPLLVWHSFRFVREATHQVNQRNPHDLSPLVADNFPKEILPFAHAINALLAKAQSDLDAQKRFIADASHELRSPLTAISLQVQHLQRQSDLPKIHTGLNRLSESIAQNQRLIDELLTLARLSANIKSDQSVSLSDISKEAVGFLLPIISDKNLSLHVELSCDFAVAIARTPLLQLIKNLLQNAVIYTPDGGQVSLTLGQDVPKGATLVIGTGQHRSKRTLCVADAGAGIAKDDYHKVFEPFTRLSHTDSSDTSTSKGTGLGLAMVKAICEQTDTDVYFGTSDFGGLVVCLVFAECY